LSRPFPSRNSSAGSFIRVNGKIRAREVRVIGPEGKQLGVHSLNEALAMARQLGVDLVEIAATATPPVCRLVDFGKFRYEQSKKEKESRKHQHATQVKEIQLSARIDPHDLGVKTDHAVDFLCEDMKVKVVLKFRGREMAHTEFGFEVVNKFLAALSPYGHPDFDPKLLGRSITLMISPLPRNKRARNPRATGEDGAVGESPNPPYTPETPAQQKTVTPPMHAGNPPPSAFGNTPFRGLDLGLGAEPQGSS